MLDNEMFFRRRADFLKTWRGKEDAEQKVKAYEKRIAELLAMISDLEPVKNAVFSNAQLWDLAYKRGQEEADTRALAASEAVKEAAAKVCVDQETSQWNKYMSIESSLRGDPRLLGAAESAEKCLEDIRAIDCNVIVKGMK